MQIKFIIIFMSAVFFPWTSHWEHWWIRNYKWVCSIPELHQMWMHYRKLFHKVIWASGFEKVFQLIPILFCVSFFSCFCPNFSLKKYCGNCNMQEAIFVIRKFDITQVCPVHQPFPCFCSLAFLQNSAFFSLCFQFLLPNQQISTVYLHYVKNFPRMWDFSGESAPCGFCPYTCYLTYILFKFHKIH